jgi:pyruvate, water dikinase
MALFRFLRKENVCHLLVDPDGKAARKLTEFKQLLERNDETLEIIGSLEGLYYGGELFTMSGIREAATAVVEATREYAAALIRLSGGRYADLNAALERIESDIRSAFVQQRASADGPVALRLSEASPDDAALVGGKAANLATLRNRLGLPTPDGFVATARAFDAFMAHQGLGESIARELDGISPYDLTDLSERCGRMRRLVMDASLPPLLEESLENYAGTLRDSSGEELLALRSSAIGEDSEASFAGQYETVLGVPARETVDAYKTVIASKYTPKAILYRLRYGLDEEDTPMAVLVLPMVRSRSSGVLYTVDPTDRTARTMRVDSLWGLGEQLVSGRGSADVVSMGKSPLRILEVQAAEKSERMELERGGGFSSRMVPERDRASLSIDEATALQLGRYGMLLESHFGSPQDAEWAVDEAGRLLMLQSRPLDTGAHPAQEEHPEEQAIDAPVLLEGGKTASSGTAAGTVFVLGGAIPAELPEGALLVAGSAAPEYAALLDSAEGIVTDHGGVASHLASVARELGIPALFDTGKATGLLAHGTTVTIDADARKVYEGRVDALLSRRPPRRGHIVGSPMHQRLRRVMDHITPLTLTDPAADNFTPRGCRTVHDIVRFAHEKSLKEMFGLSEQAEDSDVPVVRLKARIPLILYCMDLGGGLRRNATTCDEITPDDLRSQPMLAVWKGLTHPGISWKGAVGVSAANFASLMATSIFTNPETNLPGGDSYALLSREYMNLSARFGYHFANVDSFCGDDGRQNHVILRFAGGAGNMAGKSLRLAFLAEVLGRLGFLIEIKGEVLEGSLKGMGREATEKALDQLGRLLGSSRLLDLGIASHTEIGAMADRFFRGDYEFLEKRPQDPLPGFTLTEGDWERIQEDGMAVARQDGTRWASSLSTGMAGLIGRLSKKRYQRFLDSIEAYFHFPLAIAKDIEAGEGRVSVKVRPVDGRIDQAGGLAFGVRNSGNYLVLRVNALEDNLTLFEFRDGERKELSSAALEIPTGRWHELSVDLQGRTATCLCDGRPYLIHHRDRPISGYVGLWTKADSVTDFKELVVEGPDSSLCILL